MKYRPAKFWVIRETTSAELWLNSSGLKTSYLKEARRILSRDLALFLARDYRSMGVRCAVANFDSEQRRTVRLHAEGGK